MNKKLRYDQLVNWFTPCNTMERIKSESQFKHEYIKLIARRQISSNSGTVLDVKATLKQHINVSTCAVFTSAAQFHNESSFPF